MGRPLLPHSGPFYRIFGQKSINARLFGECHKKKRGDGEAGVNFFGRIHNPLNALGASGIQKEKLWEESLFQKETVAFKPDYRYNKLIHYT